MRKIFFLAAMLAVGSLSSACDPAASNNAANKPANAANTAANTAAKPADAAAIETEIKKAVTDMATALQKGDAAYFEKLYTDNYMFVGPDGSTTSGPDRVASMKSGQTKYETISYDEVTVRSNPEGNGAISISRATVKGVNLGRAVDGKYRVTHVWSKTKDGWRLASGQTTLITGGSTSPPSNTAATNSSAPNTTINSNK